MKNSFKYILTGLSLLTVTLTAAAQSTEPEVPPGYSEEGGIATAKHVSNQNADGTYTITLETFATGQMEVEISTAPADIVLVLDLSQSMTTGYGSSHYEYTARNSQGYSYNGYGNNQYYYRHNGDYYRVYRDRAASNRDCVLYFDDTTTNPTTRYYLSGTGITTTRPTNVDNNTQTIWTGVLYSRAQVQGTRLSALQDAVESFLEEIYHNDNYEDDTDAHPRDEPLGNRLSVVTFGGPMGNDNVTKVNIGLTDVTNADGTKNESIISSILALNTSNSTTNGINNANHYGTYSDEGMALANDVLNGIDATRKENSTRTVVLFTDGEPGRGSGWTTGAQQGGGWGGGQSYPEETDSPHTADRCIQAAHVSKVTHEASVFTVVLYSGTMSNDMRNYLQWTSSNYPQSTSYYSDPGTQENTSFALEAGNDLQGIFKDIAHASGGASASAGTMTQVRDYVTSSFNLPIDTSTMTDAQISAWVAENIHVYTSEISSDGDDWGALVPFNSATIAVNSSTNMVSVEGFDYSADENWVGKRYDEDEGWYWSGKKLVIQFDIEVNGESTGGVGTATNTSDSGVYLYDETTGTYTCVNHYEIPHTLLPVNIKIRKNGLRSGESATFEIQKCRPMGWNENGATLAEKMANVEYNALGKPKPSAATDDDWETFSKVILTNKSATNGAAVEKTILCLDPYWVYKVKEDDWGWAYVTTGAGGVQTTATVEVNPFTFTNEEKTGVPKHAEAVAVNHFATSADGTAHTESYKSSKD